jgi:uroporphyrin-III C-methyltransferase
MSVALVGAGPGDPGLITVRGLELVRSCDVLVYDRLVAPELVDEAPADATRIARDPFDQEAVNGLLVGFGRAGLEVVRLKGGDPFVFGRGGEEALALADAGVRYEVVPGVSSLSAVPAAAGFPVTHRGVASQATLAAGHDPDALDYRTLARAEGTIVLFMAFRNLSEIAERLVAHGRDPQTPAAVIAAGTTGDQDAVFAPLVYLADAADALEPPALVVLGDVVGLAERLRPVAQMLAAAD